MSIFRRLLSKIKSNQPPKMVSLTIKGEGTAEFKSGTTLLQAAKAMDADIKYYCGGTCSCGTCHVQVLQGSENLSKVAPREKIVLGYEKYQAGDRLACQARLQGPVEIHIPDW